MKCCCSTWQLSLIAQRFPSSPKLPPVEEWIKLYWRKKGIVCVCACKRLHNCCCFGPFAAKSTQLCITMYDDVWWHALMSLMISYQGCTINWFREWPAEALYSVAKQQLTMNQAWPWSEPARHWRVHGRVDVDDVARFCSCDKLRQVATPEWTQCS